MAEKRRALLVCSCEGTLPLEVESLSRALAEEEIFPARNLCRTEIGRFLDAAAAPGEVLVGCTQEAPLFAETAEAQGCRATLRFANIREAAGWSVQGAQATPKMAALLAQAWIQVKPAHSQEVVSQGRVLVLGRDASALAAARQLAQRLSVVCVLADFGDQIPLPVADVALFQGRILSASGHVGGYTVIVGSVTQPRASSRSAYEGGAVQERAVFEADLIFDLRGGQPLFPGNRPRDGYFRVEPGDVAGLYQTMFEAAEVHGVFDKPRAVVVNPDICAHSRSGITGCTRCMDACPTGAITPRGNAAFVDQLACSAHGACSSVCPTGAISWDMPRASDLFERLRVLLTTYRRAGGEKPVVVVHDERTGVEKLSIIARLGRGLPANVLPFAVQEVTATGYDLVLAAMAWGAARVVILTGAEHRGESAHLHAAAALVDDVMGGLGHAGERLLIEEADDPDIVERSLWAAAPPAPVAATFSASGPRRNVLFMALDHLHKTAPEARDVIPVPPGAPFGRVDIRVEGCTLCLSCVGACPTAALGDNPDKPTLSFLERDCIQCGLCVATCPEKVVSLVPQIDFIHAPIRRILKEEEPFECVRCSKPFGSRSTVERMVGKLAEHSMFKDGNRIELLKMCDNCRVIAQAEIAVEADPFKGLAPARPLTRTTDDYLREREATEAAGKDIKH